MALLAIHATVTAHLILAQQLLDLPYVLLRSDRELQILLSDRVPVLVDHHHTQQSRNRAKEQSINVVLRKVTNLDREDIKDDLTSCKEDNAKDNVSQRPAIIQRVDDQHNLQDHIDQQSCTV